MLLLVIFNHLKKLFVLGGFKYYSSKTFRGSIGYCYSWRIGNTAEPNFYNNGNM